MVRQLGGPEEVEPTRNRVDGTDKEFHPYLHHALPCHCYAPIVSTIVNHKKLQKDKKITKVNHRFKLIEIDDITVGLFAGFLKYTFYVSSS